MALDDAPAVTVKPPRQRHREVLTVRLLAIVLAALIAGGGFLGAGEKHLNQNTAKLGQQETTIKHQQGEIGHLITRIEVGAYGACHRLNIERARVNKSNHDDYVVFKTVAKLTSSVKPATPPTPEQEAAQRTFLKPLKRATNDKSWTPLTNCVEAVRTNPAGYVPPAPQTFTHHPAPRSAYVVGRDN